MNKFVPAHARFIVSMLLGSISSGVVWILVLMLIKGSYTGLNDVLAYVMFVSAISLIVLAAIGWPIFAIFRRSSRITFRVAASIGLICGFFIGAFSLQPLDEAWTAAGSCAGTAAAAVSWWWSYRPGLAQRRKTALPPSPG